MLKHGDSRILVRIFAEAALLGIFALSGQVVHADDCQRRIERADHRLHEAIEHHGYRSDAADRARHELREQRERCWNADHRWWDADQRRWHSDRDWDDDDHRDYGHHDDDR